MKAEHRVLRIIIDTREQRPYEFPATFTTGIKTPIEWRVETSRETLIDGIDYALADWAGMPGQPYGIGVQRKASFDELAGNIATKSAASGGAQNMLQSELHRLSLCRRRILIVDQPRYYVPEHSGMNIKAVLGEIDSCCQRWGIVPQFSDSREDSVEYLLAAFRRYHEAEFYGGHHRQERKYPDARISTLAWADLLLKVNDLMQFREDMIRAGVAAPMIVGERDATPTAPEETL